MKRRFAFLATLVAGLIVLSGCGTAASSPTPADPHVATSGSDAIATAPSARTSSTTVDAYQATGKLSGITGEGDAMKCDPSLATISVKPFSGSEWNGTVVDVKGNYVAPDSTSKLGVLVTVAGTPVEVKSGILRLSKNGYDEKSLKSFPVPDTVDLAFNMPATWHQGDTLRVNEFNFAHSPWAALNQLSKIELCIVNPKGQA